MADNKLELFIHLEGELEPRTIEVSTDTTLLTAITDAGIPVTDEMHVFAGDWDEGARADTDDDEAEDTHEPEVLQNRLCDCEFGRPPRVHCVRCRRVRVTVGHNGRERRRAFSPAATVATVTVWAHRAFHIDPTDAANIVLKLCGTDDLPSIEASLAQLIEKGNCELCFDLVPKDRIEGQR